MDYELTETQEEIETLAYQVAVRDIKPIREKHDADQGSRLGRQGRGGRGLAAALI